MNDARTLASRLAGTIAAAALVTVILVASPAVGSVYDDATAWWHFDMADSGVITNANDIRDQRNWQTPGGYKATAVHGTLEWTNAAVVSPGGGQNFGGRSLEFNPLVSGTNVQPDAYQVDNLTLTGSSTVLTRFKWDGYTSDESTAWMYNNAFHYGDPTVAGNGGFLFGIAGSGNDLRYLFGNQGVVSNLSVTPGTWYDAAFVLTDNGSADKAEFYLWGEGGALQHETYNVNHISTAIGPNTTIVGGESTSTTPTGGNAKKAFDGQMNHLAVWNRAISEEEVNEAFGYSPPGWTLGLDNSSNLDLRLESETDADYTVGEPWHEMRRAVTGGNNEATVNFDMTVNAQQPALPFVFHLDNTATGGGQPVDVSVSVNGTSLGTHTVQDNSDQNWWVPANVLQDGTNSLTIRYESGPGSYTSWDWMQLAGSWQVGYDDNSQAEFSQEGTVPSDFYITDPNWKHLERAVSSGSPSTFLHFTLSDELANSPDKFAFLYTTEVISQNPSSGNPFDVLINGYLLGSVSAQPNNTVLSFEIPSAWLSAGDNVIALDYQLDTGWTQFDYHRLEVMLIPEPATFLVWLLGGLCLFGCVRRRRRR